MNTNTTRPLLVIRAEFRNVPLAQPSSYYESLVFNFYGTNSQSVAGWFRENSNGRFGYSRAASVMTLQFSGNESRTNIANGDVYQANIVRKAMLSNRAAFTQSDSNSDSTVTDDELEIVVISNDYQPNEIIGGHRAFGSPQVNGLTASGSLTEVGDNFDFYTIVHENCHGLSAPDLYASDQHYSYCANNITMMRCRAAERHTFHLDPWHKLQLGWAEPRIVDMRTGGVFRLPAAQLRSNDAAVLLYDSRRGVSQFFMLEYRTTNTIVVGPGFDRDVASSGLAVWHIKQDTNKAQVLVPPFWMGVNGQIGWEECTSCHGLFFQPDLPFSDCPATGATHTVGGLSYFSIIRDTPADPGQAGWKWCFRCRGLFYGPNEASSACPAGGTHDGSLSRSYSVRTNAIYTNSPTPPGPEVDKFRRCAKCQGMFMGTNQSQSTCPEDSQRHLADVSINYHFSTYDQGVFTLAAPDLTRGGTRFWTNDTTTPSLLWEDAAPTKTRIQVRPFAPSSNEIIVDVLAEEDTWVDFNYVGSVTNGMEATPYRTMAAGVANAGWRGTVKFKTGSSPETQLITKPLTFIAPFGTATIGQ